MTEKILNVAPEFDTATEYSFSWNQDFLKKASEYNPEPEITSLLKGDANKSRFKDELEDNDILIFFDHGNKDVLIGQNKVALLTSSDAHLLNGKKVYTMACLSAQELGKEAFKKGCLEYWGATESIGFTIEDQHLFGEVFVEGAYKRFIEGESIEDVMEQMKNHFTTQIGETKNPWTKIWLQKDSDIWVCWYAKNPPPEEKPLTWWEQFIKWLRRLIGLEEDFTIIFC